MTAVVNAISTGPKRTSPNTLHAISKRRLIINSASLWTSRMSGGQARGCSPSDAPFPARWSPRRNANRGKPQWAGPHCPAWAENHSNRPRFVQVHLSAFDSQAKLCRFLNHLLLVTHELVRIPSGYPQLSAQLQIFGQNQWRKLGLFGKSPVSMLPGNQCTGAYSSLLFSLSFFAGFPT